MTGGRAHGRSGCDRQSARRGTYNIKIKCVKVGLTYEGEIELGEMPRSTATKGVRRAAYQLGSQGNTFVGLIYLVKVEEQDYWRDYVQCGKIIKKCL